MNKIYCLNNDLWYYYNNFYGYKDIISLGINSLEKIDQNTKITIDNNKLRIFNKIYNFPKGFRILYICQDLIDNPIKITNHNIFLKLIKD